MFKTITIPTFLLLTLSASFTAEAETALDWATGSWGIELESAPEGQDTTQRTCQSSPVIITIDKKNMRYKAVHTGEDDFVATAPILKANDKWITLQYDDETRTLKNGNLHKWHMVFVSPDKFYWVLGEGVKDNERDGIIATARVRCEFKGV